MIKWLFGFLFKAVHSLFCKLLSRKVDPDSLENLFFFVVLKLDEWHYLKEIIQARCSKKSDLCMGSFCAAWCSACKASAVLHLTATVKKKKKKACRCWDTYLFYPFLFPSVVAYLSFSLKLSSHCIFGGCLHLLPSEVSRPHAVQPCGFTAAHSDRVFT